MSMINNLLEEMILYYSGDPKRIQHFVKVYTFARLIGKQEHVDSDTQFIVELSAVIHDIGIKPAEEKYGSCAGKLQEQEGPAPAKEMLKTLQVPNEMADRICWLIAHHHTYDAIKDMDHQILVEADFLVNLYEDEASREAIITAYNKVFKTHTGKQLCKTMFALTSQPSGGEKKATETAKESSKGK